MKQSAAEQILQSLKEPMQEYRAIPFWSWNEKLSAQELARQIEEMKKTGVGGYFMHARSGLETDYLQKSWFDCINTGIENGQKHGLRPWAYDEEGWPSGFAGGYVTQKGDWVYARGLRMRYINNAKEAVSDNSLLGVYVIDKEKNIIVEMTHSYSPFYVDVLNKEVIAQFIAETHEKYAKQCQVGGTGLAGFFTDEPRLSEGPIPWSYILPKEFEAEYGYEIMPHLPSLYLPWGDYHAVRHDFWELVNKLFVNAYMKQQGDWCEEHGCKLTGHMMMEESLYSQMTGTGGSMPFYEFMQQPGVDSLRRNVSDPRIPKQVGSVAEQLGKRQVISESYALSGWDLNFDEMRWIASWQFVNGVNLICQHLQAYSLKGERKRDYPPSLFHQQTWYSEYYRFNNTIARLGQLLGTNKKEINVLLLHPMHSGWITYDGTNNAELAKLDEDFSNATLMLSGAHIDYHLGDETILRRHAGLKEKGCVSVGEYTYNTIVLPSCITLDEKTVEIISHLVLGGGKLICLGTKPTMCKGRLSDKVARLLTNAITVQDIKALKSEINLKNSISIKENNAECEDIHCCCVKTQFSGKVIFAVNMHRTSEHNVCIELKGEYEVSRLCLDTLKEEKLQVQHKNGVTFVQIAYRPMEAIVLSCEEGIQKAQPSKEFTEIALSNNSWQIKSVDNNALTLDMCQYSINNGPWQEKTAVIHLMKKLLDMKQECFVKQKFSFNLKCQPQQLSRLQLVIEQPDKFKGTVNGKAVTLPPLTEAFNEKVNHKDIAFYKTDILQFLHQGENIIQLECNFKQRQKVYDVLYGDNVFETELNKLTYDIELESIYLIGDFGVFSSKPFEKGQRNSIKTSGEFALDILPAQVNRGDLTSQGFAFFAGVAELEAELNITKWDKPIILNLGEVRSALTQLYVNDKLVKTFLWGEFSCDITNYINDGANKIMLKLFASNRNLLGPHHHIKGECYSVGPLSFTGRFSWAERESEAVVITPEMRKQNFWQNEYSFVTFGV